MQAFLTLLLNTIRNPDTVVLLTILYIFSYYLVSFFFMRPQATAARTGMFRRNGPIDVVTSVIWFLAALMLLSSLFELALKNRLPYTYLVLYYVFFIFLFAFCYGLLEWHFPGMLKDLDPAGWNAELQYILISIGAQTGYGYSRSGPARLLTECIAAAQALLGIFFVVVFIAKAVGT